MGKKVEIESKGAISKSHTSKTYRNNYYRKVHVGNGKYEMQWYYYPYQTHDWWYYNYDTRSPSQKLPKVNGSNQTITNTPASWAAVKDTYDLNSGNTSRYIFESGWEGWNPTGEGNTNGAAWQRKSGTYGSVLKTGCAGGTYALADASTAYNSYFVLSKNTDTSKILANISFYYYMYGSNIGTLYIDVKIGSTWYNLKSIVGQQQQRRSHYTDTSYHNQDPFFPMSIYTSNYDGTIANPAIDATQIHAVRFRYRSTSGSVGDVALDHICLSYNTFQE